MTWPEFIKEFKDKYFNPLAMSAQQTEFSNLKQGNMTVAEAMDKFNRLARLCPQMVKTEEDRVRRMMEMFRPELALNIDSGSAPLVTVADCLSRAIRAEYCLGQVKEDRTQAFRARREEQFREKNAIRRPQGGGHYNNNNGNNNNNSRFSGRIQNQTLNQNNGKKRNFNGRSQVPDNRRVQQRTGSNSTFPTCKTCGRSHFGECRKGTFGCFNCG